ncbi:MAG: tyrosine--tRNA ligase [Candidatus Aenigmarchaeota archaeon ex4484_52]|nr:MAG: tyrosine--tRNA ligase [Candidatus Aenigmarchaeota archaeon ex4484_52]
MNPNLNKKLDLIKQVGEEIITENDLNELLKNKKKIIAYDGFEPSGNIHIAQGLLRAINIGKFLDAGISFKMFIADWHAWLNNKFGGDLDKIKKCGDYFIEVWKSYGLDTGKISFVYSSDIVKNRDYWELVLAISRHSTIKRTLRCSQIMGRAESMDLSTAQLFYPCMQAADIFYLNIDIAQLGMDQRKANMLAREIAPKLGFKTPVAVHHHMLAGLLPPKQEENISAIEKKISQKMSKSNPMSAIFMTDDEAIVNKKIAKAYCPIKQAQDNPILEYLKYIVFEKQKNFRIERPQKYGGNFEFENYEKLEKDYIEGIVHPADLKPAVAKSLNKLLEPTRKYFKENTKAKKLMNEVLRN